jgi:prophage tail gpP-like protein
MATFGDTLGVGEDRVVLHLGEADVLVAESYDVVQSILTQPSHFTLRLGWGSVLAGLIQKATPGTPFQLRIADTPRFTGQIDGYEATSDGSGGGVLTIHGRDNLAPIHDAFIEVETSYQDATYLDMVVAAVASVSSSYQIFSTNDANRKLTTGIGVKPDRNPSVDPTESPNTTGPTAKQLRTRVGERLYEFIKRQLDRAGLFLWAAGDGSLVLSQPNGNQPPIYKIVRQRGQTRNAVNALSVHYRNATEGRYSEATIYGRGGGKSFGPTRTQGAFVDTEMQGYGFHRPLVLKDTNCNNNEQAQFYARRKLAETRRMGWSLVYTVSGHTVPALGTGQLAVWAPDTVVAVDDQELSIAGNFYIEHCVFRRNPQTTTELTLMKPGDLIFATGEAET